MENFDDEEIFRLILFKRDFEEARECFQVSKRVSEKFIRNALAKMGVVCYARPFMVNTGIHKEVRKYRYSKKVIPDDFMWLHEIFMDYRGNFIGHTNFKTIMPEISRAEGNSAKNLMKYSFTDISFDHWYEVDGDDPEGGLLIDYAITLSEKLSSDLPGFRDFYKMTTDF